MEDKIKGIAERYLNTLLLIEEMMLLIRGDVDTRKLLTAIQVVHLERLQRCHDALQGILPEKDRKSFAEYLTGIAEVLLKEKPAEAKKKS